MTTIDRHDRLRRRSRRSCAALVVLIAATVLATGCSGVNRLREAQDAFNQAAAAENNARFGDPLQEGPIAGPVLSNAVGQNGYASVLLSLEKLEQKDIERLKRDKLWGNVLALKALSQWRLGLFDRANETAQEAQKAGNDQIQPRDRALLLALPGLIKVDEAFLVLQRIPQTPDDQASRQRAEADRKDIELLVVDAGTAFDVAQGSVDARHPVHIYLLQARLAGLRTLQVAYQRASDARVLPAKQQGEVKTLLRALQCHVERSKGPTTIVSYWSDKLSLTPSSTACPL